MRPLQVVGLLAGVLACVAVQVWPTPAGLAPEGQSALAVMALCVCWWVTGPVALPVTSLVGLALLPVLGAMPTSEALALFGNQAVFFVIGVFLVAAVLSHTGITSRVTLLALRRFARSEVVLANAVLFLSWGLCFVMVSHAVAAILLPIVLELIRALDLGPRSRTARRLLLSMAWGTVCGSNLTLLSSARASLALELYASYRERSGLDEDPIGLVAYTAGAAPISVVSVALAAVVLHWSFKPEGLDLSPAVARLNERVTALGKVGRREGVALLVMAGMIVAMVVAGPRWLGVVALLTSGAMFLLQVLRWEDAERYVNWGVALMYGGAIAVGGALYRTGATTWLAREFMPDNLGPLLALGLVGLMAALFTEVVSNAAVIAVVLPIALPLATEVGLDPRMLVWTVPLSAGFAFLLPTSTPAMAMVFGTGYLRVRHTARGLLITALSLLGLVAMALTLWPMLGLSVTGAP